MFFYIWNSVTEEYETGGYAHNVEVEPETNEVKKCRVHVPEGCELRWSHEPLVI